MVNIYDARRWGTIGFLMASVTIVVGFLYVSNDLVRDLSAQERSRMQIWADATREIIRAADDTTATAAGANIDFLLSIIEDNRNIPVLLTDDHDNILLHRNFNLPEPIDSTRPYYISEANASFLQHKLEQLRHTTNVIHIVISPGMSQHLYYEDSRLLRRLSYFPYIQLAVMVVFVLVVYYAVVSTKRAEQNKVWVGLSKETAHQLGTPISSLMAWMELLRAEGIDPSTVDEMDKDVQRLGTIAARFSKIGSRPGMDTGDLNHVVDRSTSYMATRISSRISLSVSLCEQPLTVELSAPLLEWVMENLIKNAVDAMEGTGAISVATGEEKGRAWVEITDTGKGIPRKNFKTVFNPGFTTKKRGWGLGLTLARRIIEQYHGGRIYVKSSEPFVATTFRIDLPLRP